MLTMKSEIVLPSKSNQADIQENFESISKKPKLTMNKPPVVSMSRFKPRLKEEYKLNYGSPKLKKVKKDWNLDQDNGI